MRSQRVRHDSVTELTDRNPNQSGLGSVLVLSPLGWVTWAKLLGLPKSSLGFLCKILWKTLNFSQYLTSLQNLHCLNYKHELPLSSAVLLLSLTVDFAASLFCSICLCLIPFSTSLLPQRDNKNILSVPVPEGLTNVLAN